jgi:hypothetical protein
MNAVFNVTLRRKGLTQEADVNTAGWELSAVDFDAVRINTGGTVSPVSYRCLLDESLSPTESWRRERRSRTTNTSDIPGSVLLLPTNTRRLRRRSSRLAARGGDIGHAIERLDDSLAGFSCWSRVKVERSGSRVILSAEEKPEGLGLVLNSPPECQPWHAQCKKTRHGVGRAPGDSPCQSLDGKGLNLRRPSKPICLWPRHDGSMAGDCAFSETFGPPHLATAGARPPLHRSDPLPWADAN